MRRGGLERPRYGLLHEVFELRGRCLRIPRLELLLHPRVLRAPQLGEVRAAGLDVGEGMAIVPQVLHCGLEFEVELFKTGIRINVQVEEVTESVVVVLELERGEASIERCQHLLGVHVGWRERWTSVKDLFHDFFGQRQEDVQLDLAILSDPSFPLVQQSRLRCVGRPLRDRIRRRLRHGHRAGAITEAPRTLGLTSKPESSAPSRVLGPCSTRMQDGQTRQAGGIERGHPVEEKGSGSAQTGSRVVWGRTARHEFVNGNKDKQSLCLHASWPRSRLYARTLRRPNCERVVGQPQPRASPALPASPASHEQQEWRSSCRGP
ncbi:hypothetical protein B5807_07272 [Epicoccum nigrum]|uniref:Uncharacterized protein n=1 Tax=Epicoccum nigrum TaxID=105696 RepID=A0A1Y2LUB1_EPING|nr:hypothetical protein B5807_07272 [Epicoccum nigrum]